MDLLSIINGTLTVYHDKKYFEISGTYSKNERSRNLTYLFEFIIYELSYNILSDGKHSTPDSKECWQVQIKRTKFDVFRFNIKKILIKKQIWKKYFKKSDSIELKIELNRNIVQILAVYFFKIT